MPRTRLLFRCFAAMAAVASTGCSLPDARFTGQGRVSRLSSERIAEVRVLPPEYQVIGGVKVRCRNHEQGGGLFSILLDHPFCDVPAMKKKLREAAASNGGELLVGCDCDTDIEGGDDSILKTISCEADVATKEARD
jgi:hypothetical protein